MLNWRETKYLNQVHACVIIYKGNLAFLGCLFLLRKNRGWLPNLSVKALGLMDGGNIIRMLIGTECNWNHVPVCIYTGVMLLGLSKNEVALILDSSKMQ